MGGIQKRCAAGRIHDTITKNLYTSEKQNKIIYTKKNPSDPSSGFFLWFCKKVPKNHNKYIFYDKNRYTTSFDEMFGK